MSNQAMEVIAKAEKHFVEINNASPETLLTWKSEAHFAMQAIVTNDWLAKAVKDAPDSLKSAIVNVASVGLSLNPATKYAYLVPRDGRVCLDISYLGLVKMATDTGSIMWCRADAVYEQDTFEYNGPAAAPIHVADPFSKDRGEVIGVYCIAKTADGDYLVETMKESEVQEIKAKSKSTTGKNPQYSPWNTFPNEMRKKAIIKRASKTWPKTDRHERLSRAIEYVNQEEGINFREPAEEDIKLFHYYIHEKNGAAIDNLMNGDVDDSLYWAGLQKSFAPKGQIGKHGEMIKVWRDEAIDYVSHIAVTIQENPQDEFKVMEVYNEMNEHELKLFWRNLSPETKTDIENILHSLTASA